MSDYINRLISRIVNKKAKTIVKNELDDHFSELVDYYLDIGYNQETAKAMAEERFGEAPEQVGEQLSSIHYSKIKNIIFIISIIVSVLLGLWGFVNQIADSISEFTISTSVLLMLLFFINLLLSLKFKSVAFSLCGLLQLFPLYLNVITLILMIIEGLTGRLDRLIQCCIMYEAYTIGEAPKHLAGVLVSILLLLDVLSIILAIKFNKLCFGKKAMKFSLALKHIIRLLIVILLIFFIILIAKFNSIFAQQTFNHLDQIIAVESNVPLSEERLNEICKYNDYEHSYDNYLFIHIEIFSNVPHTHCDGNFYNGNVKTLENKFDSYVSFMTYEFTASYSTNSKYVYFIPEYYDNEIDTSSAVCVQTGKGEEYVFSYNNDYYVIKVKVR